MLRPPRLNWSSSNTGTGWMTVSNSWKPSARFARILSRKLTLHGDWRVSVINKKGANIEMLAPAKLNRSVVENVEAAARNKRRHVAAKEPKGCVGPERRIGYQMRFIAVWINGVDGHVIGEHRVMGRERRGDDFINTDPRAHETSIKAPNEPGGVTHVRALEQGGLLHGTADLPEPRKFNDVSHATSELLFECIAAGWWARATACQERNDRRG